MKEKNLSTTSKTAMTVISQRGNRTEDSKPNISEIMGGQSQEHTEEDEARGHTEQIPNLRTNDRI